MEICKVEITNYNISRNTEDSRIKHVITWLKDKLINWESYEALEWSDVVQINVPPYKYVVYHKFNHKNGIGFVDRLSVTFYLDQNR